MSLTYQLIKTEIDKLSRQLCAKLKANDDGKKFSLLLLKKLSGKKDKEVINLYTDGSGDHQIDGVYLEEEGDLLRVSIITCKYFSKATDHIPDKDVSDLLNNGLSFLILGEEKVSDINSKIKLLKEDIDEERKNYEEKVEFSIKFISTSKEVLSNHGKSAVEKFICEAEKANLLISYQEINSDNLSVLFSNRTVINTSIPIKLSGKSYYSLVGRDGFVCRLPVNEITKIYKGFKDGDRDYQGYYEFLFTDNVRKDLGLEKRINQKIYETATNTTMSSDFEYFNNGLTIVYEQMKGALKGDSPTLYLSGLQVVNGCQTVSTLIKADDEGLLCDDVYVTTKFIRRTDESEFIQSVINYTNTQNAITDRDLHSNDLVQYDIQGILKNYNYLYERKLNEYRNEDSDKRIDALEAAQAYLCCELKEPHTAKQKKNRIFRELYHRVFNKETNDLPYKLFLSYKVLEYAIQKRSDNRFKKSKTRRKGKIPRYHFKDLIVAHGSFHIASLIYKKCFSAKQIEKLQNAIINIDKTYQIFEKYYCEIVDRLEKRLKKKEIKKDGMIQFFKTQGIQGL